MNEPVHSLQTTARTERAPGRETTRTNDPERTKANILAVAEQEFGEKGLAGARIDEIAAATQTSKRMIYYYFGSKEGLYLAVLKESYRRSARRKPTCTSRTWNPRPRSSAWSHLRPAPAQQRSYVRIVMSENIHRGQFLRQSQYIQDLNVPAIDAIREPVPARRGQRRVPSRG